MAITSPNIGLRGRPGDPGHTPASTANNIVMLALLTLL